MRGYIRPVTGRPGVWRITISLGYDGLGKRKQRGFTVHGTRKDAERVRSQKLAEFHAGRLADPSKMTVAGYLEMWLRDYAKSNVEEKTYETYADFVRVHLVPAFGRHLLTKLQPLHIQAYYTDALARGRKDGKGGLSARSVLHHHRLLSNALRHAVRWQLLPQNPCDRVTPPRPRKSEGKALNEEQLAELLEGSLAHRLYIPILLAATTAMRRGEILALRWQDVTLDPDRKKGLITVKRSAVKTRGNDLRMKEPKSGSGRPVALSALPVEILVWHKGRQAEERLALGPDYQVNDLVCCHADGSPVVPNDLTKSFGALAKRLDLPITFHGLRHSHASALLSANVHPKIVQERLGHSTIAITLDLYSHAMPHLQQEGADQADAALRAAMARRRQGAADPTGSFSGTVVVRKAAGDP